MRISDWRSDVCSSDLGMKIAIAFDSTIFIEKSIDEVFKTVFEAVLLVVIVIFLFLRSWRATLIPLVTIPVSLIGAFGLMYAFGFTINTLTLLAMEIGRAQGRERVCHYV